MTDEQKEDLQFWFYTKVFADKVNPPEALEFASTEVGTDPDSAFAYLKGDGRVEGTIKSFTIKEFDKDEAEASGVFVDIEWMLHILHRNGLRQQALWKALGSIYKIPTDLARQEAEQIVLEEGEE